MAQPYLRHLIQTHPIIDNHAHNLLSQSAACDYTKYPFEQIISEAQGVALRNASSTLPFHRAAAQLATLYQTSSSDWDKLKAARDHLVQSDYEGLVRRCLEGTHTLLLDDLLTDQDIEPFESHDRFTASSTKRIVRIEAIAAQVLSQILKDGFSASDLDNLLAFEAPWETFSRDFITRISEAIRDPAVVGFKSVICYRTGLDVQPTHGDTRELLQSFARTISRSTVSTARVEDKPLNDWLVREALNLLTSAKSSYPNKPLQLHTGLGDNDINLLKSNPAHLQSLVAQYPDVDFVLLHSSYPYTREAGYLACVYSNVYLDLGEVFPMVSRDAQEFIVRESLEIVPTTRLLWSTDGHFFPETFWLANKQFRDVLETVFVDYVEKGDYTNEQAMQAAVDILFYNSNRLYCLNEKIESPKVSLVDTSPISSLEAFMRSNPDIKYIWMQFIDYTATVRLRMFPILEFAKIVRKQRRIGISVAVFGMLQDDGIAGGSTTGQFYMVPDLSTIRPNVGLDSKSATVMTWWKTEEDGPLEECPRTTLLDISNKLKTEFDIQATCGFEIEVVFMKQTATGESWGPVITNHSWSQMTRETRRMLPLLEEIDETLASIGIYLEQFHSESSPGQFEFILPPDAPVAAVDALIKARQVITHVAEKHDLRATLHPRPFPFAAGTASHAHVSITPPTKEEPFLAGVMHHYPSLAAMTLSNDASYERVKAGIWAGGEWVMWGTQNREAPIRKISPGHWEIKTLDGLANMYLAMSAFLAAGYAGLTEDMPLTHKDCEYDASALTDSQRSALGITTQLPNTLTKSLEALESNETLRALLGPTLVDNYITVKRAERQKLNAMDEEARRKWLVERY
ncbi:extracellular developmental signal biosynthesis protein FluG [Aspergillus stella-maris]|uniref:extracellular developmental signal biosynthesis protein FluG n=1 Tax=Aspergillus stella-maris TaxID=1810926 RepID=UPI003CCD4964